MFWLISWLAKIALSPVRAVKEVIDDVSWSNWEANQWAWIMSMWVSSIVKWLAKWVKEWVDDIYKD